MRLEAYLNFLIWQNDVVGQKMRRGSRSEIHLLIFALKAYTYENGVHRKLCWSVEQHKEAATAPLCISLSDLPVEQTKRQEEQ